MYVFSGWSLHVSYVPEGYLCIVGLKVDSFLKKIAFVRAI